MTTAVVVTYNSADVIGACLAALSVAAIPTIVVDNASRDDTLRRVQNGLPDLRIVARETNGGYAAAVTEGAALAPEDDVLIVNPDVIVPPDGVPALESYLAEHPDVGIAVPRLVYPDGTVQESVRTFPSPLAMLARRSALGRFGPGRAVRDRFLLADDLPTEPRPVHFAIGAALLVRRRAMADIGGLRSRIFLYGEDVDWCYRMWAAGWEVHIVPDVVMEHRYRRASRHSLDLRSPESRHHWAGITKLFLMHPSLLVGRGPRRAHRATERWAQTRRARATAPPR